MRLEGIQMGRAVAALMVVVFHANVFFLPQRLYDGVSAGRAFNMGYSGVEFFFVLSGFIMVLVHRRDFGRPDRALAFLRKRVVRIYPILWVVLVGVLILDRLAGTVSDPATIAASFTLWPIDGPLILIPAWSLQHEMLFYLLFLLAILDVRLGLGLFGLWILGCIVAALAGVEAYPYDFLFGSHNLLFPFGMLAALIATRVGAWPAWPVFTAGALLFLAVGLSETYGLTWNFSLRTVAYGIGALGIVVGLARGVLPAWRPLVFLGDASYSIYLVHGPALMIVVAVLRRFGAPWGLPPLATLVLISALATAAGALVHVLVERPLIGRLRSRSAERLVAAPFASMPKR